MQTITLYIGAHGSEPDTQPGRPATRSSIPDRYEPDHVKVNFLSFAGFANIKTLAGLVFVREPEDKQEEIIQEIKRSKYDNKYQLFESNAAKQLNGLGTDRVALSYLVPRIFNDKEITSQAESISVMEDIKNEMLALGLLAGINYPKTSPPVIVTNPTFEKMWWFDDNVGDDRRRFDTQERTGPARAAGNREDNPILSTNGLFILDTTNEEHQPFSISNIRAPHEITIEKGLQLITSNAIKRRNLLRTKNYTSYWQLWIEASDFSEVPDEDVIKIGRITEAVFILKQIYYAFHSKDAMDDPADNVGVAEEEEEDAAHEPVEGLLPPPPPPPPQPTPKIKQMLEAIIQQHLDKANSIIQLVKTANVSVKSNRARFLEAATAADNLEERIEEKLNKQMVTRQTTRSVDEMKQQLSAADIEIDKLRTELTNAKDTAATLESELDVLKSKITADVTELIRDLISHPDHDVKAAIKNIIMRNKLKNILKIGILYKRLSLSQIILFFRSLGYNIINIVDPSCFVLKPPPDIQEAPSTQEMFDSQHGLVVEPKRSAPPLHWSEELDRLADSLQQGVRGKKGGSRKSRKKINVRNKSKRKYRRLNIKTQKNRRRHK